MSILVTAPHALTPVRRERASDRSARVGARQLVAALRARGANVEYLEADVVREECDLNRAEACDSPSHFKDQYRAALARRPAYVIDMHSFPDEERWQLDTDTHIDAVVLYEARYEHEARALAGALRRARVNAYAIAGQPGVNFIITEASRAVIPNVLVELNESDPDHDNIVATIVEYVVGSPARRTRRTNLRAAVTRVDANEAPTDANVAAVLALDALMSGYSDIGAVDADGYIRELTDADVARIDAAIRASDNSVLKRVLEWHSIGVGYVALERLGLRPRIDDVFSTGRDRAPHAEAYLTYWLARQPTNPLIDWDRLFANALAVRNLPLLDLLLRVHTYDLEQHVDAFYRAFATHDRELLKLLTERRKLPVPRARIESRLLLKTVLGGEEANWKNLWTRRELQRYGLADE